MIELPFPPASLSGHAKGHWRSKSNPTAVYRELAREATKAGSCRRTFLASRSRAAKSSCRSMLGKRATPRRKAPERVAYVRQKPKAGAKPTAQEKRHMGRIAALGCLVCRAPAEVHHVHSDGLKRITRSHRLTTPLCPIHHRTGLSAVHAIGHAEFAVAHQIDLLAEAIRLWQETENANGFAG